MSQRTAAEAHIFRQQRRAITQLLNRGLGQEVRVYKRGQDVHTEAYGSVSGSRGDSYRVIRGIGTGDDFFVSDSLRAGSFEEGWLWTDDQEPIESGAQVEFIRADGRSRFYYVVDYPGMPGWSTQAQAVRYRLAAVDQP